MTVPEFQVLPAPLRFEVAETSGVGAARRGAADLAARLGFGDARQSDVAIVVTELAMNLVKHAGRGEVLLRAAGPDTLSVLALDRGPGLLRPQDAFRDGYSTAGTSGTGLGAVHRLAATVDLYSASGRGTVVWAQLHATPQSPHARFDVGVVHVPYPGETVNGDGWSVLAGPARLRMLVVDGLGHGPHARAAAHVAEVAFTGSTHRSPMDTLQAVHGALRGTRGAVGLVAELDVQARRIHASGVGNITAAVVTPGTRHGVLSNHGTLGQEARRITTVEAAWPPGAALIAHTDGLSGAWGPGQYPGLLTRSAHVIAGVLYRDFARGRDDATIVVIREGA